jgi:hypothetical protein
MVGCRWLVLSLVSGLSSFGADVLLRHATIDLGGGVAHSTDYHLVSSVGLPGGLTHSADDRISHRLGYVGLLNDPPILRTTQAPSGDDAYTKIRVTTLLGRDQDPEGDTLMLRSFDHVSAEGGRVSLDGSWLLYQPPTPFPGTDTFQYTVEDAAGNLAVGSVTVRVAGPDLDPSQNLMTIAVLPNGSTYLTFIGIAGRTYAIEWTDQLPAVRWETLAWVVADPRGRIEWVDPTPPTPPQRYYRTRTR